MAGWTLLTWAGAVAVLGPLSSAFLTGRFLRGERAVVGNEEILAWALTPSGALYLLLAGSLALVAATVRFAGLSRIVIAHLEGRPAELRRMAVELFRRAPSLLRLCLAMVAAGGIAALPLAAGLGLVYRVFLAEYDINYYLAVEPPEWWWAVGMAGVWVAIWAGALLYVLGRSLLAIPLYLDRDPGATDDWDPPPGSTDEPDVSPRATLVWALAISWGRTRGTGVRLLRLLAVGAGGWALVRVTADALFLVAGSAAVDAVAALEPSLRMVALVTFAFLAGSVALDALIGFLGFSYLSILLTNYFLQDTGLHLVEAPTRSVRELRERARDTLRPWMRPARLTVSVAGGLTASFVVSGFLLARLPPPHPVVVHAHRAGPPPAPENTLAALERSIAAGADYAEIDVQRAGDGTLVILHDVDLMRMTGDPRRIADVRFAGDGGGGRPHVAEPGGGAAATGAGAGHPGGVCLHRGPG